VLEFVRYAHMIEQKAFSGWAYITRAPDVANCWLAHFLDFNIMSQGDSPQQALEMVREAAGLVLADDLNSGRDPHDRQSEATDWEPLLRLFDNHTKVLIRQLDQHAGEFKEFAAPVTVVLRRDSGDDVAPSVGLSLHAEELIAA
jgi:predicted RNase H-like HicB family nuclease